MYACVMYVIIFLLIYFSKQDTQLIYLFVGQMQFQ